MENSSISLPFKLSIIACTVASQTVFAQSSTEDYSAVLPTVEVIATEDTSTLKGYVNYREAQISRNNLATKEIPQTIDIVNIQKNKNYGTNDLSSILEGNAGIDASYDMRGENIYLRGFQADANDIYRDGIRESGQVRRSTANIERVEILKGPSSILYGRTNGGGVINMVSKYANFNPSRSIGLSYGSWATRSANVDLNQVVSDNLAVRLTGELGAGDSFRQSVENKNRMISPSIAWVSNDGKLSWIGQYTYDSVWRVPDRNPAKVEYDKMGIDYKTGFARAGDFVKDKLEIWRSDLNYALNDQWRIQWVLGYRKANQNFDHYYAGRFNPQTSLLAQNYAWQITQNKTLSNSLTLNGEFETGSFKHKLTVGFDHSKERRSPTLATKNNQQIDPYQRENWTRIDRIAPTIANQHKATSYGIFLQDLVSLTETLKLMLGSRYDTYRFESTNIKQLSRHYRGESFSPNIGIIWDTTPNHTLYASYSKSFSPYGGRSYLGIDTSPNAVLNREPEYSRQYEVGIKSYWLENKLSTTLSAYQLEHYNIRYRPDSENNPYDWRVRGKEQSQGIELSAIGQIRPNWYIRSSLGWLDAKIKQDNSAPHNVGRQLNATSRFNGNFFVRYARNDQFYGEVGITRVGKRFFYNERSKSPYALPSFNRIDAMVSWNLKPVNITFAVSNLLNKQYWRSESMPSNSRSYTLRLNYSF